VAAIKVLFTANTTINAQWHIIIFIIMPYVLTLLAEQQEGHPACKKLSGCGASMVICLKQGADLHMAS